MRKFIIKYWFGQYDFNGFKIDRAAVWNSCLMIIAILVRVFVDDESIYSIPLMLLPISILIFTTFIYLPKYPVKWDELDINQKHYYGLVYTINIPEWLWPEDFKKHYKEWVKLDKSLKK